MLLLQIRFRKSKTSGDLSRQPGLRATKFICLAVSATRASSENICKMREDSYSESELACGDSTLIRLMIQPRSSSYLAVSNGSPAASGSEGGLVCGWIQRCMSLWPSAKEKL